MRDSSFVIQYNTAHAQNKSVQILWTELTEARNVSLFSSSQELSSNVTNCSNGNAKSEIFSLHANIWKKNLTAPNIQDSLQVPKLHSLSISS